MLLLALDTATPAITVALHDGSRALAERTVVDARRHGELLAPQLALVLADAGAGMDDVTELAVGVGPGPFTGLRVGVVTALVLARARHLPVHGVCTLDALAFEAVTTGAVAAVESVGSAGSGFVVATDARRREVHWAAYRVDGPLRAVREQGPHVDAPGRVDLAGRPVVGRGADLYPDQLGRRTGPADPSAGALASYAVGELRAGRPLLPAEPLYLRRPDAVPPGPPKAVGT